MHGINGLADMQERKQKESREHAAAKTDNAVPK